MTCQTRNAHRDVHQTLRLTKRLAAALLLGLMLSACGGVPKLEEPARSTDAGLALFDATTVAHGREAFGKIKDLSIAYDSHWYDLIQKIQPILTDGQFRQGSEERLIIADGITAQTHKGTAGTKVVLRQRDYSLDQINGGTRVWFNGEQASDQVVIDSASLVVDAYRVFIFGPLHYLAGQHIFQDAGTTWINDRLVDKLLVITRPGLGESAEDRHLLYIDRESRLTTRIRFTLEGLQSTKGAVVETDFSGFVLMHGVMWPTVFFERVTKPIPNLPAHRWSLLGLDINRGLGPADFTDGRFSERAAAPAKRLP